MSISQGKSDQELLQEYLAGGKEAISQLLERYRTRVYDYILMMVKDASLADDLYQESMVKVVRVIDEGRYRDNGKFLSWVMRIAHNQVIDHFRSQRHNVCTNEHDAGFDILAIQPHAERSVEDIMVGEQIEADLRKLVEHLPEEQKEVVRLRYWGGLSFKEIAEHTNVGINTALGRMRYALINLRRMIKEKNIALE